MRSCDPVSGEAAGSPAGTACGIVSLTVRVGPQAAVAARAGMARGLSGHVSAVVLADAQLLVSELVTNSVRHAGLTPHDFVRVGAEVVDGVLLIEVDDPGTAGTVAPRAADMGRGGGFGLRIVEAVSRRWGIQRNGQTRVWAELLCAAPPV
ncbi:MAG: serine/threonine-protein kinase RsbW [Solirubrobacteraceae bacterium]|jgi:anti-sigma regulatory factor (Ser/Thr protein kinase)|nr:serine/threonine-protein kinase RsbW [Solirubrobacteraceae bacterium]